MKKNVNPSDVLGTWEATSTNYKESTKLFTNSTGVRLKLKTYENRANSGSPYAALIYDSEYLTGLWHKGGSESITVYSGDIKVGGKKIDLTVYESSEALTITQGQPNQR